MGSLQMPKRGSFKIWNVDGTFQSNPYRGETSRASTWIPSAVRSTSLASMIRGRLKHYWDVTRWVWRNRVADI